MPDLFSLARLRADGGAWIAPALAALALLSGGAARAEDLESDAVYLPAEATTALAVRNPLGTVKMTGWDRPQIRIIAHKRAGSRSLLERLKVRVDLDGADVRVTTGFYLSDGAFTPLPLAGGAIDLTIEAPRGVALTALTFSGDIDASGFRAGAHLSSQAGRIRAADVEGPVDTRTLNGNQWLEAIRGSLLASGAECDLELDGVSGKRVDASVYKGRITARDVTGSQGALIRLRAAHGTIVLLGELAPGAQYDLATRDGDVRLELRPAPFTITARAPSVRSGFALKKLEEARGLMRAAFPGGPGAAPASSQANLTIASASGEVVLQPFGR